MDFGSDHLAAPEQPTGEESTTADQSGIGDQGQQSNDDGSLPPLDSLPDEYREIVEKYQKSFQSDYTIKRKQEAEALKAAEGKTAMLDRMLSDPDYAARVLAAAHAGNQPAQQTQAQPEPWMNVKPEDALEETTLVNVKGAAFQVFRHTMSPILEELGQYKQFIENEVRPFIAEFAKTKQEGAWKSLESKFSNASQYKQAVDELRQKAPSLSYEDALHAVARGNLKALGPSGQKPAENKRQGQLFNGNTSGQNRSGGKVDLTDLISQARRTGGQ